MADQSWPAADAPRGTAGLGGAVAGSISRPWALALLGIVLAVLVLSRKPDALLHAELWAEDGWR